MNKESRQKTYLVYIMTRVTFTIYKLLTTDNDFGNMVHIIHFSLGERGLYCYRIVGLRHLQSIQCTVSR